jgi:hypothetical protein
VELWKIKGSRKRVERGTCLLCPGEENSMHISLAYMERDNCREDSTTTIWIAENEELACRNF